MSNNTHNKQGNIFIFPSIPRELLLFFGASGFTVMGLSMLLSDIHLKIYVKVVIFLGVGFFGLCTLVLLLNLLRHIFLRRPSIILREDSILFYQPLRFKYQEVALRDIKGLGITQVNNQKFISIYLKEQREKHKALQENRSALNEWLGYFDTLLTGTHLNINTNNLAISTDELHHWMQQRLKAWRERNKKSI